MLTVVGEITRKTQAYFHDQTTASARGGLSRHSVSLASPVLQAQDGLTERIEAVMSEPEFAHAHFGVESARLKLESAFTL